MMEPDLPPDAGQQPPQGVSPAQVFVAHKQMGLSDLDAALKTRDYLRGIAGARGSFRNMQDLVVGLGKTPLTGDALQKQLYDQADQPVADAQARASVKYGQALSDPAHPSNVTLRAMLSRNGVDVPPNFTLYDAQNVGSAVPGFSKFAQEMGQAQSSQAQAGKTLATTGPEAQKLAAEAGKTGAETEQIAPNAAAERTLKGAQAGKENAETTQIVPSAKAEQGLKAAEAGKAEAEAAHTRMLTSGEVVPGYVRGSIPIDETEAKKINDQYEDLDKGKRAIGEILNILGNKDFIANPTTRARLAPRIGMLMGEMRASSGVRQVAGPELHFLEQIVPDPNNISVKNILGLAQNATRLRELSKKLDEGWQSTVKAKGLIQKNGGGGGAPPPAGSRVDLYDPAGKPVNLPAEQVDDYLKANPGAKRV